ncbi:2-(acetamidomethylene)succinate hydrolase [Zhongshania aliphaticivorans]|uniref:2-(Acetamidomethylene)succinate hydrolase n=1 Tax=Zhongshania aliphaticivorans TaxID=1470434 RepID=A0A5S9MZX7_9GAMM|nr:alpha/beta hydrolase [Zhongshania aliphaticivorans]CAA0082749.1 2-(acetamidomethylene)succinate hydrolase [Zhongshania aliphaticivorans]CAA0083969.1 2-(acetamidomethylene)succinate hydrolase [Zhongshania aliphaticivorans]
MQNYSDYWYQSSDGLRLYARQYGNTTAEQTIICIPGLTRNSSDFTALCEHLAPRYRILAVDLRGRGQSDYDTNPENYHPGCYANDILSLMGSLALPSAIFIGTSLGGIVSMVLAATAPERIQAIVMNDIGPEPDKAGLDRIKRYVGNKSTVKNWSEAVEKTKSIQAQEYPNFSDEDWLIFSKNLYRENALGQPELAYDFAISHLLNQQNDDTTSDLWPLFTAMQNIPLLLFRGELSDILNQQCVRKMQTLKPDMQFVEIPHCGHAPLLSETEALNAIDNFLIYNITST